LLYSYLFRRANFAFRTVLFGPRRQHIYLLAPVAGNQNAAGERVLYNGGLAIVKVIYLNTLTF